MKDIFDGGPNTQLIGQKGSRYELQTPALLIDLEALDHNIEAMAHFVKTNNNNLIYGSQKIHILIVIK